MNRVIEYIISAKDRTASAVSSALSRIRSFSKSVVSNLANVKAGFDMVLGAVKSFASLFASAIREAFRFEKALADFKVLLGSIDAARDHIAQLRAFASSTPLTFPDLAKASKLLLSFGASADSIMPSLKMLGDISMGDAQKFQGLALVFAQVQSAGKLMGQDLLQMINQGFNPLTIIAQETGKSVAELKDMMAEGAISFEMVAAAMRTATAEGGLFHDALKETSTTGEGLMSTLSDKWADAVRTFGAAFTDTAKGGVQALIDRLTQLVNDGSIEKFADKLSKALVTVMDKLEEAANGFKALKLALWDVTGVGDAVHGVNSVVQGVGSGVGALVGGGSFWEAYNDAAAEEIAKGYYGKKAAAAGWLGEKYTRLAQDDNDSARAARLTRVGQSAAPSPVGPLTSGQPSPQTEEPKSLRSLMDEVDEKRAEEQRRKDEEAAKRAAEKKAADEARLRAQEERERRRIEERIHAERVRLLQQELAARQSAESAAAQQLAAAQQKSAEAWGWYRDKDSLRARLDEERANAAAEAQFEKDFDRLRSRRSDWRTAADFDPNAFRSLSLDETAVKRVALAREEEKKAREYAQRTAENTERAADALDEIRDAISNDEGSYA